MTMSGKGKHKRSISEDESLEKDLRVSKTMLQQYCRNQFIYHAQSNYTFD